MKEIWKDIKGYEGYYQVSNLGNVRSVDRIVAYSNGIKHLWKGRILKLKKNRYGYFNCYLCKNSKYSTFKVHRLVAQAFIHNPNNLPQINHKDEDKTNNCVDNLEWCTCQYNNCYGTRLKRQVKKLSKSVLQLDINTGRVIAEYPSANEAGRQLNIFQSSISKCCRGEYNTAYGFKWQYKKE